MFPIYPEEQAKIECFKLMKELDEGLLDSFLKDSPGLMFGVAVCRKVNALGNTFVPGKIPESIETDDEPIVLRAFSGQLAGSGRWNLEGFVPPCIDVERWKKEVERADPEIKALTSQILSLEAQDKIKHEKEILELKAARRLLSNESLRNIYGMYEFMCWDGHVETYETLASSGNVFDIPTGTGDCCAPKLINYAFRNGLQVISMAEFFYGNEPRSKQKVHKEFYSPCDEKCGILLPKMLGLSILYRDDQIIVINKPSGVLSAPGKGEEKFDCIPFRVRCLVPSCILQPCVHRLDMDTSGILVLGLTKEAHRNLSMQFEARTVHKKYRSLLRGKLSERFEKFQSSSILNADKRSGTVDFPMRVDLDNRPYQIYDEEYGRKATTEWKLIKEYQLSPKELPEGETENWRTLIEFLPLTGRTHQLRLHSSHEKGLCLPMVGDRLYGKVLPGERLCLQAYWLEFSHPSTDQRISFEVEPDF